MRLAPARLRGMATANPSGKFWIPIPMAKAMAPAMVAPSMPLAAAPNNTPTAKPSGMLWSVMANTNRVVLCNWVLTPSVSCSLKLMWRCGSFLSKKNKNIAPVKKPTAAGIQDALGYIRSESSMEGNNNDQKLAATMTPPVKPSMPSSRPRCMFLKKKTRLAPAAVTNQVKVVAKNAAKTGSMCVKKCSSCCMVLQS